MVIEIAKNTPEKKIKKILKELQGKKFAPKSFNSFFGKLPDIENGLACQKKFAMSRNNLLLNTNTIIYALKGLADVRPYFFVPAKKQPWAASLCHSLVPHTSGDL